MTLNHLYILPKVLSPAVLRLLPQKQPGILSHVHILTTAEVSAQMPPDYLVHVLVKETDVKSVSRKFPSITPHDAIEEIFQARHVVVL
jgi:hypothetical protein